MLELRIIGWKVLATKTIRRIYNGYIIKGHYHESGDHGLKKGIVVSCGDRHL